MKYVDEFRDKRLIEKVARKIHEAADPRRTYNIMEVCGTHTMNIFRFGLRDILPKKINLISGPGCPVCVTPNDFLDKAIELAGLKGVIIASFGDMLKVPASHSTLAKEKAEGRAVRVVYSTTDALGLAKNNPKSEIVFLGIGFETTAPTTAASILTAKKEGIKNYSVLSGHKTMPEALEILASDSRMTIEGFLLPGHVSAIIGRRPYEFLSERYRKRCVIAGFEPLDIMESILMLITQETPRVEIEYSRVIDKDGNALARKAIGTVFEKGDSAWRGLGLIKNSGLAIRKELSGFDAEAKFKPKVCRPSENKSCICGDVLKGVARPTDCKLFAKACTPEHPAGSCMVSAEGACAAYFKYSRKE